MKQQKGSVLQDEKVLKICTAPGQWPETPGGGELILRVLNAHRKMIIIHWVDGCVNSTAVIIS